MNAMNAMNARLVIAAMLLPALTLIPAMSRAEAEVEWGESVTLTSRARVIMPTCDVAPFDMEEFLASLRLEFLGCGVELVTPSVGVADEASVRVTIDSPDCSPRALLLRIELQSTGARAEREVDLSDRPATDRSRVLALSIAELYRMTRAAPAVIDPPEPNVPEVSEPIDEAANEEEQIDEEALRREVVSAAVAEIDRRRQREQWPDHRVRLGVDLVLTSHPVHDSGLFGSRLLVDVALSASVPIHLVVDAGYRRGGGSDALGMVRTQAATGGIALRYEGGTNRLRGALGPRLELGWSRIEGEPIEPGWESGLADGFLLTIAADGAALVRFSRRIWMVVGLSLGYVLVGLDASSFEHHVGSVAGPFVTASLGLAVGL